MSNKENMPSTENFSNKRKLAEELSEDESDEDSSHVFKWDCNNIRRRINSFLATKEMTQTAFLRQIGGVNSNSFGNFMKLKGPATGCNNRTYSGAHHFFEKREKQAALEKKSMSAEAKKRKTEAAKSVKSAFASLLAELEGIELPLHDDSFVAVYESCDEVRKKLLAFISEQGCTTAAFCKAIGVQSNQWNSFLSFKGIGLGVSKQPGAANACYSNGYELLEKLRVLRGQAKSAKRLQFEREYPTGYCLEHDDGKRWVFCGRK
jgi:hypothetical protein